ncbi:MAG: adenylate/guanylate cyclase domain-containing protein, partial [Candidatus Tectomicrobia bacterium]|nr:adenylate/guanylate cyclase domain-containing protein [Candidatus Tectomicrobia bacterium]
MSKNMNFELKNKPLIRIILLLIASLLLANGLFWLLMGSVWTEWDFKLLDQLYRRVVRAGYGPLASSRIVFLTLTNTTYEYFGHHGLDRMDVAEVNDTLGHYRPEAVAYDIIFARPSTPETDQRLAQSIAHSASVYLPIGVDISEQQRPFAWAPGAAYERLRSDYLKRPREQGNGLPLYATQAIMQTDALAVAASHSGHIGISSDSDGVYRHLALLVKIGSSYFPTLSLTMFLDHMQVPFENVLVHWGRHLIIPATSESWLETDVVVPIDRQGRLFIPTRPWQGGFESMPAHQLLQVHGKPHLRGNLADFFEGKFVFIGDVSTGASDLGPTSLESETPLLTLHASLLNALLTQTFYHKWSFWHMQALVISLGVILALAAIVRASWVLYVTGVLLALGLAGLVVFNMVNFDLLPIASVGMSGLVLFFGLVVGLQVAAAKERAFIRGAFSKYVPETVVSELLQHPERLQLGGEERVLSILFSDVEGFTTLAETMPPDVLVQLINEYLSEMTAIVLAHGGIIDKYEGDLIMAEFGAPLALPDHAAKAVQTGLAMQQRLGELRQAWAARGLPQLRCRIGINTGLVIVGNMGSSQVFDYTVMGDAVNVASRLESANKQYDTALMISECTHAQLPPGRFRTRLLDIIRVKGRSEPIKVYDVYAYQSDLMADQEILYYQTYHEAIEAYFAQHFAAALKHFDAALAVRPQDRASHLMIDRIGKLQLCMLPEDWDGA